MTKEEIKALIIANTPAIDSKIADTLSSTFENTIKNIETISFQEAQKKVYNSFDEQLKNLGFEKKDGQKTSEFINNVLTGNNTKIKELEEKIKNQKVGDNKDLLAQIDALKKDNEQKVKIFEEEKKKLENTFSSNIKKMAIKADFPNIKTAIPDTVFSVLKEKAINDLQSKAKYEDGKIVYRDENGNILLNSKNQNNPFTTKEMLESLDYMKPVFEQKQETPKIGGEEPPNLGDKEKIIKELRDKGLGEKEIYEEYKRIMTKGKE